MQVHEFYGKYANTKLGARLVPIEVTEKVAMNNQGAPTSGKLTLMEIYSEVKRLDEIMSPMRLLQQHLIEMGEKQIMENQA